MTYSTEELRAIARGNLPEWTPEKGVPMGAHDWAADLAAEVIRLREREAALTQERDRLRDREDRVREALAGCEALLPENGAEAPETKAEARTDEARRMVLKAIRAALGEGGE